MRGSGGRQLADLVPAASHEKGESLDNMDGGKGWSTVMIIENGVAAEQETGGEEKLKYRWLEVTQRMQWARGARGRMREPAWQLGGGRRGAAERVAGGELDSVAKAEGRLDSLNRSRDGR
jgi:hypothetical protein